MVGWYLNGLDTKWSIIEPKEVVHMINLSVWHVANHCVTRSVPNSLSTQSVTLEARLDRERLRLISSTTLKIGSPLSIIKNILSRSVASISEGLDILIYIIIYTVPNLWHPSFCMMIPWSIRWLPRWRSLENRMMQAFLSFCFNLSSYPYFQQYWAVKVSLPLGGLRPPYLIKGGSLIKKNTRWRNYFFKTTCNYMIINPHQLFFSESEKG